MLEHLQDLVWSCTAAWIWIHTESTWHHCEYSPQGAPTYCIGQLVPFCFMSLRSTISEGKPSLNYFVPDSKHKQLNTRLGHKFVFGHTLNSLLCPDHKTALVPAQPVYDPTLSQSARVGDVMGENSSGKGEALRSHQEECSPHYSASKVA